METREWWPPILIQLHKHDWVNYPPVIDSILSALVSHTASYLILDKEAGSSVRAAAVKSIVEAVQNMDRLHEEAMQNK